VIGSVVVSLLLTVLFAVTGGYALLRWAELRTEVTGRAGDQVAELAHLLMSIAMIAMTWGYATTTGTIAQIVLFAGLGGYFMVRWFASRCSASAGSCPGSVFHLLMCAAMVWMVVAMPWLMASASGSGGAAEGGAAGPMDGMVMPMSPASPASAAPTAGAPSWAGPITELIVLALLVAAGYWARTLVRPAPAAAAPTNAPVDPVPPAAPPAAPVGGPAAAPAGRPAVALVAAPARSSHRRPASDRLLAMLTPRADAACHGLMSLAMAAMLLLMR
jgi:hypothetical protein